MNSLLFLSTIRKIFLYTKYVIILKTFVAISFFVLIFTNAVLGQKSVWRYVTTVSGGAKVYINDEIKNIAGGNKTAWEKMVMSDGTFTIALAEWDCSSKRRLTKQLSLYNSDQTVATTIKKKNEWSEIIPDSTSNFIFSRLCLPPPPEKWAQIISEEANLRSLPISSASVIKIAMQGDKFYIVPESGEGGWYNVVDTTTQQDYWLHGNTFKIVEAKSTYKPIKKKKLSLRHRKLKTKIQY